ncbi:MAG: LysR family transcriptional regulator [Polynucleobacter sp. GWA2_45_21]|nr:MULTISPECIES: LysR family transcriptional regulator [unclassified Polynucleobacter]OHC10964.1 MAG: LysR family transcriptional regulator [Polynucleobacter sp. GWA2_45_21]HBK44126.1 LysR family transcriptional regulator [Polynucleobacter sp.]
MNFTWLEDFLALASSGNFSRAAEERHMTQPAFSRRIRALEEWIGADLFNRSTQPATLTDTGTWFESVAKDMITRAARIPGEARAFNEANSNALRIASTHALSFTFMPSWLRGLESKITIGQVQLVSDVMQRCEALLLESQVQFLLTHSNSNVEGELDKEKYPFAVVGKDTLIPVSAPNKAGNPQFTLDKATAKNPIMLLSYSQESGIGRIVNEMHNKLTDSLPTQNIFTAHLASVLRTMALDARGIAWLPETLIAEDIANGKLVEAAPHNWCIEMEIRLYRDKATISKAGEAFWEAIKPTKQSK